MCRFVPLLVLESFGWKSIVCYKKLARFLLIICKDQKLKNSYYEYKTII